MAKLYKPDGTLDYDVKITCLEDMQAAVGGLIEVALQFTHDKTGKEMFALVNEEGIGLGLAINSWFIHPSMPSEICGNILLCDETEFN